MREKPSAGRCKKRRPKKERSGRDAAVPIKFNHRKLRMIYQSVKSKTRQGSGTKASMNFELPTVKKKKWGYVSSPPIAAWRTKNDSRASRGPNQRKKGVVGLVKRAL